MLNGHRTILFTVGWQVGKLLRGVAEYARTHHWHLVIQNGTDFRRELINWRGDGVLSALGEEYFQGRDWSRIPILSFLRLPHADFPYSLFREDDTAIGRIAADFFLSRGFRTFAVYSVSLRGKAFRETLAAHGRSCIESGSMFNRDPEKIEKWILSLPKPCALFCENDWDAADALSAAIWNGIRVPEELSVLGVGNDPVVCNAPAVPLSSVDPRYYELGYEAASEMDRILDGNAPRESERFFPPAPRIAERRSTNFFAVVNPKLEKIIAHLREHAGSPLAMSEVAKRFYLSESALYKLLTRNLGISPKQFLLDARLRMAAEQLLNTDRTVETIASECGFSTPGALYSSFRKKYDCPPGQWRTRERKASEPK